MSCSRATWKNALPATVLAATFWLSTWMWSASRLSIGPGPGCLPLSGCLQTLMRGAGWRGRLLPPTRTAVAAGPHGNFRYTTRCRLLISSPTVRTRMTLICVRFCALGATVGRSLQHSRARILSCFKGRTARRNRRPAVTLFVARPVFCEKQAFPGERGINQSWGARLLPANSGRQLPSCGALRRLPSRLVLSSPGKEHIPPRSPPRPAKTRRHPAARAAPPRRRREPVRARAGRRKPNSPTGRATGPFGDRLGGAYTRPQEGR